MASFVGDVVLFGGDLGDETWRYDGTSWAALTTATSPPGRSNHAMVWDSLRKRVVLFVGSMVSSRVGRTRSSRPGVDDAQPHGWLCLYLDSNPACVEFAHGGDPFLRSALDALPSRVEVHYTRSRWDAQGCPGSDGVYSSAGA